MSTSGSTKSLFIPTLPASTLNFPIYDRVKSPWLETKSRTADTPACREVVLGRLAQLVRAPRLHRGGRGFEPLSAHIPLLGLIKQKNPKRHCFSGFFAFVRPVAWIVAATMLRPGKSTSGIQRRLCRDRGWRPKLGRGISVSIAV